MSSLDLRNLSKTYGSHFKAVQDLDLHVKAGEFISLLGPSGCGKTTTLQMVAGFMPPTSGHVLVEGEDITHVVPEKRDMGVVFQSYALFPHMSVAQNVAFGLEMRKFEKARIKDRVEEALSMVRLSGLEDRYPGELSGGQRQRVAIARVLAIRPRVLLLDEPMSNLDAKLRGDMHVELRALQRRLGITTILVTHDQVEAMTMSDRIAVMTGGCIAELGTPQEIYDKPNSEFTFKFLGQTNIIEGMVERDERGTCSFNASGRSFPIDGGKANNNKDTRVFVRPERLRICAPGEGCIDGLIQTRLFLGGVWFYDIETPIGLLRVTLPNNGLAQPEEGDQVGVMWSKQDLQLVSSGGGDV